MFAVSDAGATLPIPCTTIGHAELSAICDACERAVVVDLAALIAGGRGDTPLRSLRLRCARCGSRQVSIVVGGLHHGGRYRNSPGATVTKQPRSM